MTRSQTRRTRLLGAILVLLAAALPARAQVKIGIISSMTGPEGTLGREMTEGFNTAVREEGGKLGGIPVQVIIGDDQTKPDIGRQVADKMVQSDGVSFITGPIFSNVLLAVVRPVTSQGVFLLSANAGPADLAGRNCNPDFFSIAFQNDSYEEAIGEYMNQTGKTEIWFLAPNYTAAFDKFAGLRRTFKGQLKEVYTQFGQMDYAPQLAQLREASARKSSSIPSSRCSTRPCCRRWARRRWAGSPAPAGTNHSTTPRAAASSPISNPTGAGAPALMPPMRMIRRG